MNAKIKPLAWRDCAERIAADHREALTDKKQTVIQANENLKVFLTEVTILSDSIPNDIESMTLCLAEGYGELQDFLGIAYPDGTYPDCHLSITSAIKQLESINKDIGVFVSLLAEVSLANAALHKTLQEIQSNFKPWKTITKNTQKTANNHDKN